MNALGKMVGVLALLLAWTMVPARLQAAPKRSFEIAVKKREFTVEPVTAKRGETVRWRLMVDLAEGWHTYPLLQADPHAKDIITKLVFENTANVVPVGTVKDPPYLTKAEIFGNPDFDIAELRYYEGKIVWEGLLVVRPDSAPGKKEIALTVELQVCDKTGCLPPKSLTLTSPLSISTDPAVAVDPAFREAVAKANGAVVPASSPPRSAPPTPAPPSPSPAPKAENGSPAKAGPAGSARIDDSAEEYAAAMASQLKEIEATKVPKSSSGLLAFILAGIFWGAVSLVTPCVFPMIPITVSFFLKQSEKEHHRPVTMALVYCSTIVIVLTLAAVMLLSFFRGLSVNPVMNIVLGALFVYFALSLFGMYEIELPSGLARFTSAREGKGGLAGTMFMALTFTIVSFACVAPFLGGFGGTAATSSMTWTERILGGLAFSATFASPFFVLALFPTLLKKMPKSGTWLNTVKVVMGFLELAAALKFFRAGELVLLPRPVYFTYDLVLGLYIALSILCGLYLLGLFRLPHDTPVDHLGVPRLILSVVFIGMGLYLLPALFRSGGDGEKQRPNGVIYAWVDSFLLPEPSDSSKKEDLAWTANLKQAIAEAREIRKKTGKRQLVFVDFTGETCTNCKINEYSVFSKSQFKELFQPYKLVQLYTDKVPDRYYSDRIRSEFGNSVSRQKADAQVNLQFQRAAMDNNETLPLYVILDPLLDGTIRVVGFTEGKINDESAFAEFLRKPLNEQAEMQASAGH